MQRWSKFLNMKLIYGLAITLAFVLGVFLIGPKKTKPITIEFTPEQEAKILPE